LPSIFSNSVIIAHISLPVYKDCLSTLSPLKLPKGKRVKERRSLSYIVIPPLLIKERGIKGVRLINALVKIP